MPGHDVHADAGGAIATDADWTRKNCKSHFGYKMHAEVGQDSA